MRSSPRKIDVQQVLILLALAVVLWELKALYSSWTAYSRSRLDEIHKMPPMSAVRLLTLWAATPVALVVYSFALFRAQTAREVIWRGVRYILTLPHTILLRVYRPLAMLGRANTKALDRDVNR